MQNMFLLMYILDQAHSHIIHLSITYDLRMRNGQGVSYRKEMGQDESMYLNNSDALTLSHQEETVFRWCY